MTPGAWWLQLIGIGSSVIGAIMLAVSQKPAPDNVHGNLVFLRNPTLWRCGFVALIAGFVVQLAALVLMSPAGVRLAAWQVSAEQSVDSRMEACIRDKRDLGLKIPEHIQALCEKEVGEAKGRAAWDACFAKWGDDACREEFQRWPGWAQEEWYLAPPSDEWMRRARRQPIDMDK